MTGAIVVSTPQDVALLDARKAISMFNMLKTPVLGLIENMSTYICPNCGHEAHIFGHGGVRAEAERIGVPFLGEIPLSLDVRVAGDAGTPIAAGEGAVARGLRGAGGAARRGRHGLRLGIHGTRAPGEGSGANHGGVTAAVTRAFSGHSSLP